VAKKIGEIYEENGRYFMQVFKPDPKGPHIEAQVYLKSTNGNSSMTKFLIPKEDLSAFSEMLERWIKSIGGSISNDYEMYQIEPPIKGV
jgi:hypothetical protein